MVETYKHGTRIPSGYRNSSPAATFSLRANEKPEVFAKPAFPKACNSLTQLRFNARSMILFHDLLQYLTILQSCRRNLHCPLLGGLLSMSAFSYSSDVLVQGTTSIRGSCLFPCRRSEHGVTIPFLPFKSFSELTINLSSLIQIIGLSTSPFNFCRMTILVVRHCFLLFGIISTNHVVLVFLA